MATDDETLLPVDDVTSAEDPLPIGYRKTVELLVKPKLVGTRLDQLLVSQAPEYSRSMVQKAIESGNATVNGKASKTGYRVRLGDEIFMGLPEPIHGAPKPEAIPLEILYEDEYLAVINKPHDMVVHPAKGNWKGTLVNALAYHFEQLSNLNGEFRSGIVHRLDRDTSGAILIAKEEITHKDLGWLFESRQVFKEYLAITQGVMDRDSDYVELRIAHHPHDRVKMIATDNERLGKEACSFYEVIERFDGYTFCRIQPRTGRTHQIRVHLHSIGCPVLADKTYSGRDNFHLSDLIDVSPSEDRILLQRQALHAAHLRFQHPRKQSVVSVEAPLPREFQATLDALRKHRPL